MSKIAVSLIMILYWCSLAAAGIVNVEFNFTPFVGDPIKADHVETVPGKASVYINNVLVAEKEVDKTEVPVLFEEREIAASVWLPVRSLGPALRKGKNRIRIKFEPTDSKVPYYAQLRWASVTDRVTRTEDDSGHVHETNQSSEGVDEKKATGRVEFEREFVADFAADLPWHHYPPVTTLGDEDRKVLAKLVQERVEIFKPNFAGAYQIVKSKSDIDPAEIKKTRCLDKGYAAGVRVAAHPSDELDFVVTGNPEIVIQGKAGSLHYPLDPKAFDRIEGDDVQMCVVMVLSILYPPSLVVVHDAAGKWAVVY